MSFTSTLGLKILFWVSTGMVLYTYVVYPVLLVILAGLQQLWRDLRFACCRGERRHRGAEDFCPHVSVIFSAYNEEAVIAEKMENCAVLDYPPERLEILLGCDGCTDRTAEIAEAARLPNARVFDFPQRSGKSEVLNRLMKEAHGEIVVFSDANTLLHPGAVRSLLRHFRDSKIGCVCGELCLVTAGSSAQTEGFYWRYETFLKFLESRLGLLLGANGAVYAIRGELFTPLPRQGIIDDFLVVMRIRSAGYSVVYDPEAVAHEEAAPDVRHEFRRRIRIGAGNFHALRFTARILSLTAGRVAFSYWSHKVFRWLVPFALPLSLFSALAVAAEPFYALTAGAGALVTVLALVGYHLEVRNRRHPLFSIPYYFLSMNLALGLGFVHFLNGSQGAVWNRTAREKHVP